MSITIALPWDLEQRLRIDAVKLRSSVEELAAHRLQEADLLDRIFTYFPSEETRELRSLARKRQAGMLNLDEQSRFTNLAHDREVRNAERLADIVALSRLRGESVSQIMARFGIRPYRMS